MPPMRFPLFLLFKPLLVTLLLAGCGQSTDKASIGNHVLDSIDQSLITKIVDRFEEVYSDHSNRTVILIEAFHISVDNFLEDPRSGRQQDMQMHWLKAHKGFLAASFFSFTNQNRNIFQIDAWPIQEGFLDSLPDYPQSGIINDLTLSINETSLRTQHGITDLEEVSLGFHALEFLIFSRAISDFSIGSDEIKVRRRQTLDIVTALLKQDIDTMFGDTEQPDSDLLTDLDEINRFLLLRALLQRLQVKTQNLFSEVNHIDNQNAGHSRFSSSSWSNLNVQISVLSELTGEQTAMDRVFTLLDQKTAADYRLTLTGAKDILATDSPDEDKLARITLLFAALGPQLDDLRLILENGTR